MLRFVKRWLLRWLLILLLVLGALAAFLFSGLINPAADAPHWTFTERLLAQVRSSGVARRAKQVEGALPAQLSEARLHETVMAYEAMCASCHGAPGKAPGALGQGLYPAAPDLQHLAGVRTPAELFWATKHGIGMSGMPAWGKTHSDAELWRITALILRFPSMTDRDYQTLVRAAQQQGVHHHH